MSQIKRLLVPTDFSATSDRAVNYAIDMAARLGTSVHLMHVLGEPSHASLYPDGHFVELATLRRRIIEDAETQLAGLAARFVSAGVVVTTHVMFGNPASSVVQQALLRGMDLIIIGTHGRSSVGHLLLGSVAERVARTAPCPVLMVRDTARVTHALPSWNTERTAVDASAYRFASSPRASAHSAP